MSSGYAQWNQYTTYIVNDVVEYAGFIYAATATNVNVVPFPITATWTLIGSGGGGGGTPPLSVVLAVGNTAGGQSITNLVSLTGDALADLTISSQSGNDVNIEATTDVVNVDAVDINLTATDKVLVSGTNEVELTAPSVKINGISMDATPPNILYYGAGGVITYGAGGGGGGGVTSLNSQTGAVTLSGANGITVSNVGAAITLTGAGKMTNYQTNDPFTVTTIPAPTEAYESVFCGNSGPTAIEQFQPVSTTSNDIMYAVYTDPSAPYLWVGGVGKLYQYTQIGLTLLNTYTIQKGGGDGTVYAVHRDTTSGNLIIGGDFDTIQGVTAHNIAVLNSGSWYSFLDVSTSNEGFNDIVYCFVNGGYLGNSCLFIGGAFTDMYSGTIGSLNRLACVFPNTSPNIYSFDLLFSANYGVAPPIPPNTSVSVKAMDFGYSQISYNPCLFYGGDFTDTITNYYAAGGTSSFAVLDTYTGSFQDYNNNGIPRYIQFPVYAIHYDDYQHIYIGTSQTALDCYGDSTTSSYLFALDTNNNNYLNSPPSYSAPNIVYAIYNSAVFSGDGFAVIGGVTYNAVNTGVSFNSRGIDVANGLYMVGSITPAQYGLYKVKNTVAVQYSVAPKKVYYQGSEYFTINLGNKGDTVTLKSDVGNNFWFVAGITSGTSFSL